MFWPVAARRSPGSRCCGARPTRPSASAGWTPPAGSTRSGRSSATAAGRRTPGSPPGSRCWSLALVCSRCAAARSRGARRHGRGAARRRGHRDRGRAVGLPAGRRPDRRARRAGPHPGARRRRRPPARLGAADAGPDPEERRRRAAVARLARAQERDLRAWLFAEPRDRRRAPSPARCAPRRPRSRTPTASTSRWCASATATSTRRCARSSPPRGRRSPTPPSTPAPARVDVYAEVSPAAVDVFVRDRGRGLRPGAVAADRHGVRSSIVDRMRRHGGTAEVRSAPGEGTEVRLHLPRPGARPRQEDR